MKHPKSTCTNPNADLEIELARRLALHYVHDAARILTDSLSLNPSLERRTALTELVGSLQTLERQLSDLEVTP